MSKHRIECWQCHADVLLIDRLDADGECPRCGVEIALDDYLIQAMDARDALAAENERLRAQIAERDAAIEEWSGTAVQNGMEVDRLTARVAELERDAGRYRWVRDCGFEHANVDLGTDCDGDNFVSYRISFSLPEPAHSRFEDDEWEATDIDAAIDAAMAAQAEKGGEA